MNYTPTNLFAGIDSPLLDTKTLNISREDIEAVCDFFSIGKLRHYEKEKNVTVSHSNFFVFVETDRGQYALKFYSTSTERNIPIEYLINRFLVNNNFPTPAMHASRSRRTFLAVKDRLAACYSFIDGTPLWKHINHPKIIHQLNSTILILKKILSTAPASIPRLKQRNYAEIFSNALHASKEFAPYDQKKLIDTCLLDASRNYRHHQRTFTRQWLHNNTTLTNFIFYKETIYILDLSHIWEDYALIDLVTLIISCLYLSIPGKTTEAIIQNYFVQHTLGQEYLPVLNALLKFELAEEYLKYVRREKSVLPAALPQDLVDTYLFHLSERKKSIAVMLEKMNDNPMLIV